MNESETELPLDTALDDPKRYAVILYTIVHYPHNHEKGRAEYLAQNPATAEGWERLAATLIQSREAWKHERGVLMRAIELMGEGGAEQSKDSPWYSATPSLREFLNLTLVDVAQWIWDHPGETFEAAKWREQIVNYVERQTQQANRSVPEAPDDALVGLALRGWKMKMGYSDIERMREALTDVFFYLRGGE